MLAVTPSARRLRLATGSTHRPDSAQQTRVGEGPGLLAAKAPRTQ